MWTPTARTLFALATLVMLYLALTPGRLGFVIPDGDDRHLIAFTLLPLLSGIGWPRSSLRAQFAAFAALGAAIEVAQGWMAVGRAPQLADFLVDCAAAAAALAMVALVRDRRARDAADPSRG